MSSIHLKDIKVYAFHGCLEEEAKIGSDYIVNLNVRTNLHHAAVSDELKDTLDYVMLHNIVKEQMAIRSNLLEHVAQRILDEIFEKANQEITEARVTVAKVNPPIGGDVAEVSVTMVAPY